VSADLSIVPFVETYVDDVVAIERRLFPAPWTEEMFRQEVRENYLSRPVVGLVGDEVVAYMIPWYIAEEVHLLNIGVAPDHQRRGYARRLIEYLIADARSGGRLLVTLEVRDGNAPARHLYESFGFRQIAIRPRYYAESGEDAIIMVLRLEGGDVGEAT
jgi:ribosomal-protein-alanine N-acetyltransferase